MKGENCEKVIIAPENITRGHPPLHTRGTRIVIEHWGDAKIPRIVIEECSKQKGVDAMGLLSRCWKIILKLFKWDVQ